MGGPGGYTSYKLPLLECLGVRVALVTGSCYLATKLGDWRHTVASSNSAINTRMVQDHEIINDFLRGMYSVLIHTTEEVRLKSMNLNTTNSSVSKQAGPVCG